MSLLTIGVALILLGLFLGVQQNLTGLVNHIGRELTVTVYLDEGISEKEIDELVATVKTWPDVENVRYIPIEEVRKQNIEMFPEPLLEGRSLDNFPAEPVLEIALTLKKRTSEDFDDLAERARSIEKVKAVNEVDFGEEGIRLIFAIMDGVRYVGMLISIIILLAALFFVFSTIKLGVYARQDEIEILRLVGSTKRFIRIPFYIEGILQGLGGAMIATVVLYLLHAYIDQFLKDAHQINLKIHLFPEYFFALFVLVGLLLGVIGTRLSIGKYLKT
jgi:cell division transport system permease protein